MWISWKRFWKNTVCIVPTWRGWKSGDSTRSTRRRTKILDSLGMTEREWKIERSFVSSERSRGIPARKIDESKFRQRLFKNWLRRGISQVRRKERTNFENIDDMKWNENSTRVCLILQRSKKETNNVSFLDFWMQWALLSETLLSNGRIAKIVKFGIRLSTGSRFLHVQRGGILVVGQSSFETPARQTLDVLLYFINLVYYIYKQNIINVEYLGHWLLNYKVLNVSNPRSFQNSLQLSVNCKNFRFARKGRGGGRSSSWSWWLRRDEWNCRWTLQFAAWFYYFFFFFFYGK